MTEIKRLHRAAMEMADRALLARQRGEGVHALDLLAEAFRLETQAADMAEAEPDRSILRESATALGREAGLI